MLLAAARVRVKEEFWKNRSVTDQEQISQVRPSQYDPYIDLDDCVCLQHFVQLVVKAREAEQFIRTNVVQAVNTGNNTFSESILLTR